MHTPELRESHFAEPPEVLDAVDMFVSRSKFIVAMLNPVMLLVPICNTILLTTAAKHRIGKVMDADMKRLHYPRTDTYEIDVPLSHVAVVAVQLVEVLEAEKYGGSFPSRRI